MTRKKYLIIPLNKINFYKCKVLPKLLILLILGLVLILPNINLTDHLPLNMESNSDLITEDVLSDAIFTDDFKNGCNPGLTLPEDPVTMVVEPGIPVSYFKTKLSGVPPGYSVNNGEYLGWCSDADHIIQQYWSYKDTYLYSSYDSSLPIHLSHQNWSKVNYILNHKQGNDVYQILYAIYYLLDFGDHGLDDIGWSMVNAANMYGSNYCPGFGDITAVIADAGINVQRTIFELPLDICTLMVNIVGKGSVIIDPDQPINNNGDIVELNAIADSGWSFYRWSGDLSGSKNPTSIVMNGNKVVTAMFVQNRFTLTIDIIGNGSVLVNPDKPVYNYNEIVELDAIGNGSWSFYRWTGDLTSNKNPETILMNSNKEVTVNFVEYNQPPNMPNNPHPEDGDNYVNLNPSISVFVSDPDDDPMNVFFYNAADDNLIGTATGISNGSHASVVWSGLGYNTVYNWYAIANDSMLESISDTWSFITRSKPSLDPPPSDRPPVANANGPYYGQIDEEIEFDGSKSTDDRRITEYYWDFGDGIKDYGVNTKHSYNKSGKYKVTLTVKDTRGATDTDETTATIGLPNRPPTTPIVTGKTIGSKNNNYSYTAISTDPDNNLIRYNFNWGDGETFNSELLTNGTILNITHNWTSYGIFTITVFVTDENNASSGITEFIVMIDTHFCGDIGYLIDSDSNGSYDLFYCNNTGVESAIKEENGSYLIDIDGDEKWDFGYNFDTGLLSYYEYLYNKYYKIYKEVPGFEVISVLGIIIMLILIRKRRNF